MSSIMHHDRKNIEYKCGNTQEMMQDFKAILIQSFLINSSEDIPHV